MMENLDALVPLNENDAASMALTFKALSDPTRLRLLAVLFKGETCVNDLAEALTVVDVTRRDDFYHTARAFLAHDPDEIELFDQAFELFWAGRIELMLELGLGRLREVEQQALEGLQESEQRVIRGSGDDRASHDAGPRDAEADTLGTYSAAEVLRRKAFEDFTDEEFEIARRVIRSLVWRLDERLTRRQVRSPKRGGPPDLPRAIRQSLQQGGEIVSLPSRRRKTKPRPLVVICDVSGSMDRYSRVLLQFVHTIENNMARVEAFVFGTRLTRITRLIRRRSIDEAMERVSHEVQDWSGGTRIGQSLQTFNMVWARRVLRNGAVVLIISDGWDRGSPEVLRREMERLQRSSYRLLWLNPLLGSPRYEPLTRGMQAA